MKAKRLTLLTLEAIIISALACTSAQALFRFGSGLGYTPYYYGYYSPYYYGYTPYSYYNPYSFWY